MYICTQLVHAVITFSVCVCVCDTIYRYSYMIDNIILLITGTLHQRQIGELRSKCHPLGSFEEMESVNIANTPAELYSAVLVDTPLGIYIYIIQSLIWHIIYSMGLLTMYIDSLWSTDRFSWWCVCNEANVMSLVYTCIYLHGPQHYVSVSVSIHDQWCPVLYIMIQLVYMTNGVQCYIL